VSLQFSTTAEAAAAQGVKILVHGRAGCHAKGHPILLFSGEVRKVEDVRRGDLLMGPDSKPRRVLALCRGREEMRRIVPVKGEAFTVNASHILPVIRQSSQAHGMRLEYAKHIHGKKKSGGNAYMLMRSAGVDFAEKPLPLPPYVLGIWLGDGHTDHTVITSMDAEVVAAWRSYGESLGLRCRVNDLPQNKSSEYHLVNPETWQKGPMWKNPLRELLREVGVFGAKHIPELYKTASVAQRLQLLAGIVDTDGFTASGCIEVVQKSERFADDIVFVARSLGLSCYKKAKVMGKGQVGEGNSRAVKSKVFCTPESMPKGWPKTITSAFTWTAITFTWTGFSICITIPERRCFARRVPHRSSFPPKPVFFHCGVLTSRFCKSKQWKS